MPVCLNLDCQSRRKSIAEGLSEVRKKLEGNGFLSFCVSGLN